MARSEAKVKHGRPSEDLSECQPEKKLCQWEAALEVSDEEKEGEVKSSEVAAARFTPGDIERLILCAQEDASRDQGRVSGAAPGTSQKFHQDLRIRMETFAEQSKWDFIFGDLGFLIKDIMVISSSQDECRSQPKTGKRDLFPLPVARCSEIVQDHHPFLPAVCMALNKLCGHDDIHSTGGNKTSCRALKRLAEALGKSPVLNEKIPRLNFDQLFSHKKVDYHGEEVLLARPIVWESVEASLPEEVGTLYLRDFCTDGVLEFVDKFENFLVAPEIRTVGRSPRVICDESEWPKVARGLVDRGLCCVVRESELFHIGDRKLVNGMFSVSKQEMKGNIEVSRLIMNLKPLNANSMSLEGDTGTLPAVTNLGSIFLDEGEILCTSSEDIRCFFYLFRIPEAWVRFMGFSTPAPQSLLPPEFGEEQGFLAARVLPMGYLNSVGIAQHVHRNVVRRAMGDLRPPLSGALELRRDRPFSESAHMVRIYLDNFDELKKVDKATAELIQGTPSTLVSKLRECYAEDGLPRHPKKAVETMAHAEVQGAWIDGQQGVVTAKPSKMVKYVALALNMLLKGDASQRELQVLGGGFVYLSMFRRPLLSGLNQIWKSIVDLDPLPNGARKPLKREVVAEVSRFLGLVPLAMMNLRMDCDPLVTASDASTEGGGACVSRGLTPYGSAASTCFIRGQVPSDDEIGQILSVGLFDGIAALRVALDTLQLPIAGHISVEKNQAAQRVVEASFPDSILVDDVHDITPDMCKSWALKFSSVVLILVGAGPPCQGVSGLNADRRGALRDERSVLFKEVPRVIALLREAFPWAQVHWLAENVASMDAKDCLSMNEEYGVSPWLVDASGVSLCNRPRLYWMSWEVLPGPGVSLLSADDHRLPLQGEVHLEAKVDSSKFLEPGWAMPEGRSLPTFTTSRPSEKPGRKPAGLQQCAQHEVDRWHADSHRYPPYQYRDINCLQNSQGEARPPSVIEREVILGFPSGYTVQCMKKSEHGRTAHLDCRKTLLGNSWSVPVVSILISSLVHLLGFIDAVTPQNLVDRLTPGCQLDLQSMLLRPPLLHSTKTLEPSKLLVKKLLGLVSMKGEDILIQSHSDVPVRYHRLRASVPAKLWRWRTISGWKWQGNPEHINVLELRAVLTTIKWRVEHLEQVDLRCVHLVDSLVVLHALTRGRSSSRKMRRTLMRVCSYLLASGLSPLWGYVDTKQNPADRPSRHHVKKRWLKKVR